MGNTCRPAPCQIWPVLTSSYIALYMPPLDGSAGNRFASNRRPASEALLLLADPNKVHERAGGEDDVRGNRAAARTAAATLGRRDREDTGGALYGLVLCFCALLPECWGTGASMAILGLKTTIFSGWIHEDDRRPLKCSPMCRMKEEREKTYRTEEKIHVPCVSDSFVVNFVPWDQASCASVPCPTSLFETSTVSSE